MKDYYDFSKARKNPYAEKMKKGYSVTIHHQPVDIRDTDGEKRPVEKHELTTDKIEGYRASKHA